MDAVNWLFIDLNSYFASIEQEMQPALRGLPIAIVPVEADSTCCIALSYQAKSYGIRAGTRVTEARRRCPHLTLVPARPQLYVEYHHRIAAAIERCIPVQQVMSCDEFACRLIGSERTAQRATQIAYAIKRELRVVGETLRCSIGIGPNRLLAKIAGEMQKPDGLMLLERRHLPHALYCLQIADIPGIGRGMQQRIQAAGILTVEHLCSLSRARMSQLWGGVWGDRLYLWLRGEDFLEPQARPLQTLSRQHILPPECRTSGQARDIVIKLLLSTARRMRGHGLSARGIALHVGFYDHPAFEGGIRFPSCQDSHTLQAHLIELWTHIPSRIPADVTVYLTDLDDQSSPSLFEQEQSSSDRVTSTLDALNARFGHNTVYPGSIHSVRKEAPTRISFGPPPAMEEFGDGLASRPSAKPPRRSQSRDTAASSGPPTRSSA